MWVFLCVISVVLVGLMIPAFFFIYFHYFSSPYLDLSNLSLSTRSLPNALLPKPSLQSLTPVDAFLANFSYLLSPPAPSAPRPPYTLPMLVHDYIVADFNLSSSFHAIYSSRTTFISLILTFRVSLEITLCSSLPSPALLCSSLRSAACFLP